MKSPAVGAPGLPGGARPQLRLQRGFSWWQALVWVQQSAGLFWGRI